MFIAMAVLAGITHLVYMAHALWTPVPRNYTGTSLTSGSGETSDLLSKEIHLWHQLDNLIVLALFLLVTYIVISRLRYMAELNRRYRNAFESQLEVVASVPKQFIKSQDREFIIEKQDSAKIPQPNIYQDLRETSAPEKVSA